MQLSRRMTEVSVHLWRRGGGYCSSILRIEAATEQSQERTREWADFRTPVPLVAFEAAGACVVTKVAASLAAREAMRTVRNSPNSGLTVQVSRVVASKRQKRLEIGAQ